jgi:CRISPR system Cascade subunit CasC
MIKTIIDFHIIQTVPPSCINRDDTGSPKTAIYGGVQRARVSSQSWKHAIRVDFRENVDKNQLGWRTKRMVELIANKIIELNAGVKKDEAIKKAETIIKETKIKVTNGETQALFFISQTQVTKLAELAVTKYDKKQVKEILQGAGQAVDVALFGRMVADDSSLNADASAQVAHAISVHKVENEFDYFTAIDDVKQEDLESSDAGAGMIGTVEFNSATLYRFATVNVELLYQELNQDIKITTAAVKQFARALITTMPSGKMNTFANQTLPSAVLVTIRGDQSVNLVGAFEEAVPTADNKITLQAGEKLAAYANSVYEQYVNAPEKTYVIALEGVAKELVNLGEKVTLDQLLNNLESEISKRQS